MESEPDRDQIPPKPKKKPGPPKGCKSPNPSGRPKPPPPPPPPDDGVVDAVKMRKVLGQDEGSDEGPTEKRLREWLKKDAKGYLAKIEAFEESEGQVSRLRAENAELREKVSDLQAQLDVMHSVKASMVADDTGTKAALEKIDRILAETHS